MKYGMEWNGGWVAPLLICVLLLFVNALPSGAASDIDIVMLGNNRFAFDLYSVLHAEDAEPFNLFYSPYSISMALAMTYAGARGDTEREMAKVVHFLLPQDRLHAAFGALHNELVACPDENLRLCVANAIWGQAGHPYLSEYLALLQRHYGTPLREVDFQREPVVSRHAINQWVHQKTEGRIEGLIPPSGVTNATKLVLGNAIYFHAPWQHPFNKAYTKANVFWCLDGQKVTVPMMNQEIGLPYAAGDGWQAIELQYEGEEMAMLILLPDHGRLEEFESALTATRVEAITSQLQTRHVCLSLPSFRYESTFEMRETLSAMGMERAFLPGADFSGIDGTRDLFLDQVYHKAFIAVDEEGTEAAAATAVVIAETAPLDPEPCIQVTVDQPFIFVIKDNSTGAVLFIGSVVDPS